MNKRAYDNQRRMAKYRGIAFELSFEEWSAWWQATGHWDQRGRGLAGYVMARRNDVGPYALDNIECKTHAQNLREGYFTAKKRPEHAAKMRAGIIASYARRKAAADA